MARLVFAHGASGEGFDAVATVYPRDGLEGAAKELSERGLFRGELEETFTLVGGKGVEILAGAGSRGEWFGEPERLRVAVAAAVAAAKSLKPVKRLLIRVPRELVEEAARWAGEAPEWAAEQALVAADMADYGYAVKGRGEAPRGLEEIALDPGFDPGGEWRGSAEAIASGVRTARDVANAPPSEMNPEGVERAARSLAQRLGLSIRVLGAGELESLGMGGILAVGRGGGAEPRLIILEYHGGGPTVALVGKTVTFDSGGLDLKPAQYMLEMKFDKSGGAAVLGAVEAAARLGLRVNLVALLPAVENMPDARSYKPLDVIRMYNGMTVEVGNTDAEGRLTLADALAYAAEKYKPRLMIDLATLTGAAVVALGNHAAALMSNNDEAAGLVEKAAWRAGEPVWRLPMWKPYEKQLESKVADVSNVGGRWGGAITAGKFLEKFVGDTPWVHLDIAGVAWVQENGPQRPYYRQKGATGWGVRTIVEALRLLTGKGAQG